jgi:hypothetical protein
MDLRNDSRSRTVTNLNLYSGATFRDPNQTATLTNSADLEG